MFIFQQEFYFVCNGHLFLEDHLMGELSLAEAEDVLHISLQHGGIGVLGNINQCIHYDHHPVLYITLHITLIQ